MNETLKNHRISEKTEFSWMMANFTENITAEKLWMRLVPSVDMHKHTTTSNTMQQWHSAMCSRWHTAIVPCWYWVVQDVAAVLLRRPDTPPPDRTLQPCVHCSRCCHNPAQSAEHLHQTEHCSLAYTALAVVTTLHSHHYIYTRQNTAALRTLLSLLS